MEDHMPDNSLLKELFEQRARAKYQEELDAIMKRLLTEVVLGARLLSVIQVPEPAREGSDGNPVLSGAAMVGFPMLNGPDGGQYYPAFTDVEALDRWTSFDRKTHQTILLNFDDYASMILDRDDAGGLVINPFGDNLLLDRENLRTLREKKRLLIDGYAKHEVKKNTEIRLGVPEDCPEEMLLDIGLCAKKDPNIRALWFGTMEREGDRSYLLIVDSQGDADAAIEEMAAAAVPHLKGRYIDMIPLSSEFIKNAVENAEPFYEV